MRTLICLFAILATCSAHASNKIKIDQERVQSLQDAFSHLSMASSWNKYVKKNKSKFLEEDYAYYSSLRGAAKFKVRNSKNGVVLSSEFGSVTLIPGYSTREFFINGVKFKLRVSETAEETTKRLARIVPFSKKRFPAKDKYSFLVNFLVETGFANSRSWKYRDHYLAQVSAPMILEYMDNNTFETEVEEADNKLSDIRCSSKGALTLAYEFEDGWKRKVTIPKGFKFSRHDKGEDDFRKNKKRHYSVFKGRKGNKSYILYSDIGSNGVMENEADAQNGTIFNAEKELGKSPVSEGWMIPVSGDLMQEMRSVCAGENPQQIARLQKILEKNEQRRPNSSDSTHYNYRLHRSNS